MILKERSIPTKINGYEALLRRLLPGHEKYGRIQEKYYMTLAGIKGELVFDKEIRQHQFAIRHYFIHDLAIHSEKQFQIDSLLLTPYFAVIFEIKNLSGKLYFETNPTRIVQETEEGKFRTIPLNQLEDNQYYLQRWFDRKGIHIPIYTAFVLAFTSGVILKPAQSLDVIYSRDVARFIRKTKRTGTYIDEEQIHSIANELVEEHQEFQAFPMCTRWGIDPSDLTPGVQCDACKTLGMLKVRRGWRCSKCNFFSTKAHEKALKDYFMLVGNSITNEECRRFLKTDDRYSVVRILNGLNLNTVGDKKARKYIFEYES